MNEHKLKEKLVEFYEIVIELDEIMEEHEWWREPGIIYRIEKLTKDRDKLVEKINEILLKEKQNE